MKKLMMILSIILLNVVVIDAQTSIKGLELGGFGQRSKITSIAGIPGTLTVYDQGTQETHEIAFIPDNILTKKEMMGFLTWAEDTYLMYAKPVTIAYKTDLWYISFGDTMINIYITKIMRDRYKVFMTVTDLSLKYQEIKRKSNSFK